MPYGLPHIDNFPTPAALGGVDTGCGVHLSSEAGGYSDDSLDQLAGSGFTWAKLLNFGDEPPNLADSTYGKLLRRKVYPVTRIYRDKWGEIDPSRAGNHTRRARDIIQACGYDPRIVKPIVQIYNELNNINEWWVNESDFGKGYPPNAPELVADSFYWSSIAVGQVGGIAVADPTSPGGFWEGGKDFLWCIRFTKALKALADQQYAGGSKAYFTQIAYGSHPYTDTKWLDWGKGTFYKWDRYDFRKPGFIYPEPVPGYEDNQGYMQDFWVHDAVYEITGVEPNIIDCEGGFCAHGGNFYRADLDKGYPESWKMPPAMHASYITSQMALQMGYTVTDPTCVRAPLDPAPKWKRNTAFWTWGVQAGWWNDCDLRSIPETMGRIRQMEKRARPDATPPIHVDPPPVKVKHLQVDYRAGKNLVQGNLLVGTVVVIGYEGNGERHRVVAGSKPELGAGGWEQVIYASTPAVLVKPEGYEPITVDARNQIPFITEKLEPEEQTMYPTPNYDQGRSGYRPVAIVLHTMVGTLTSCDNYFASKGSNVSAHYGIGLDGTVHQYVKEEDTAWANGLRWINGAWYTPVPDSAAGPRPQPVSPTALVVKNRPGINPNLYTISIEHEGNPDTPITPAMWDASVKLARAICKRWNITKDRLHIIGHYEINPVDKKDCPGPRFDISKYAAAVAVDDKPAIEWLGDFRFCAGEGNDPTDGAKVVVAQYQPGSKANMLFYDGKSYKEVYPPR